MKMENNFIRKEDNKKVVYVFSSGRKTISRDKILKVYGTEFR